MENEDIKVVLQKMKEMDSVLSLIVSELGDIKTKVESLETELGAANGSMENMLNESINGLGSLFSEDTKTDLENLESKREELNALRDTLKNFISP